MRMILALIAALLMAATMAPSAATAQEAEALALINQARAEHGCGPLRLNPRLTAAAAGHAKAMARQHFFSHYGPNGSTLRSRVTAAGYRGHSLAENIAAGYATPEKAVAVWLASPGHRDNILTCKYQETGIAVYYAPDDTPLPGQKYAMKYYWVQDFGLH